MDGFPLVVATDGSPAALAAVHWAADEADRRRLPLQVVHASVWPTFETAARPTRARPSRIERELAESCVATAAERARLRQPGLRVSTTVLLSGDPGPALIRAGDRARLLVVGSRSVAPLGKALLGSVSLPVVARARCPVVVVRESSSVPPGDEAPVVLGVGDRAASGQVAEFAFTEAEVRGCAIRPVHAWRVPYREAPAAHTGQLEEARVSRLAHARGALDEALRGARERHPGVPVESALVEERAPEALLAEARSASLLVTGARRRSRPVGPRLGPVNHAMLHHAPCPVAVVPRP